MPDDEPVYSRESALRLSLVIFYTSPWDRLASFCYGVRNDDNYTFRWVIPENPRGWRRVLAKTGDFASRRDYAWREKYVRRGRKPHKRWAIK